MRVDVIDTSVEAVLGAIARGEERVRWGVRCVAKALLLPALVMLVGCASSPSATPASPNAGSIPDLTRPCPDAGAECFRGERRGAYCD